MFIAEAVGMAVKIVAIIACVLLCGLIVTVGGNAGQYRECFTDQTCFVLIFNFDGNNKSSLNAAKDSCGRIGSTLAEIRSSEIQNYASQFLKSAASVINNVTQKNVIVNAMRHDNNTWYWINGNEADNVTVTSPQTVNQTAAGLVGILRLINNNSIVTISTAATSVNATGYICEYPNTTIPVRNCTFQHEERCFILTNMTQNNWFSARNNCLANGGDLASLEFTGNNSLLDLLNVSQWFNRNTSYWIGLRQSWWIWEESGDEVKYTNWKSDAVLNNTSLKCISLSYNSTPVGQWISTDCNANSRPHFLCLSGAPTKSTTMTSMVVPTAAYDLMAPTNTLALGLGVGLGLIVALLIVALIILVVIIIRKRLLTDDNNYRSSQSSLTSADPTKLKRGNETSLYAEVQKNQKEDGDASPTHSTPSPAAAAATASDSIMLQPCYATVRGCEAKMRVADVDPMANQTFYADFDIRQ